MTAIKHSTAAGPGFPNLVSQKTERSLMAPTIATPIWEPVVKVAPSTAPSVSLPVDEIVGVIMQPLVPGETHQAGNDRKERELVDIFRCLTVVESAALHRRLSNPSPNDELATTFGRLLTVRRTRLLAFLADARRRAARLAG